MRKILLYLLFAILLGGCRDNYELPLRDTDKSLLVVEGVLNAGQGPTKITLSQTVKISEGASFKPVLLALLSVESKDGSSYALEEKGNGSYTHEKLPLTIGQEYRLRIKTKDNKEYLSDFVVARQSPDIDAVTWKREKDGVAIFANTHDATNKTRYYKWSFDETWEIRSYYRSDYQWVGGTNIIYSPDFNTHCWKYTTSNTINIGSTAQLASDVVNEAPLLFIPPFSEKLSVRYSILLKQQALTKEAYEYLSLMKKNTESLGSIFDPQPSELRGNIKCITNPEEGVIGYLTASSFSEKRIFITAVEADWRFNQDCPSIEVEKHPDSLKQWLPGYLPYAEGMVMGTQPVYYMAPAACVDCTQRGGNLNRPSYW